MKPRAKIALAAGLLAIVAAASMVLKGPKKPETELSAMAAEVAATPSPDGIALAAPDAAAVRLPSSPNAWGGPRTGK
ncbi:MAG TPA: hypothetical protein VGE47_06255, partial [Burkholderiaceae bacterium]